jgi:hypothetical protein
MNHMDKIFKHKLEHYNVIVPEGSWENIASRLPDQKRRFRPWWALTSVFAVLTVCATWAIFLNDTVHINSVGTKNSLEEIQQKNHNKAEIFNSQVSEESTNKPTENLRISKDYFPEGKMLSTSQNILFSNMIVENYTDNSENKINLNGNIKASEQGNELVYEARINDEIAVISDRLKNKQIGFFRAIKFPKPYFKEKEAKACPFVLNSQDKSVDIYYSNDFAAKSLTGTAASTSYRDMRQSTESELYSFSAGARFGYNLSYRWNLHTGFNYSQINEKFEYIDPESNQTRIITIKDYIYDNGKIVDSVVTQQTVLVPGATKHEVFNKYRTFDIPVLGRYTIYANKNFSLSGVAGVYINIALQEKGMILDPNSNKPILMTSTDDEGESIFKAQVGLTGYGSLSLAYHLTSNVDFLLEPNIRIQTESITNENYALKQKFNTYGISTGLRYKF